MAEILRFVIFTSIGLFNTFVDLGVWNLLYRLFNRMNLKANLGFLNISNYLIAHTFSFSVAAFSSYILNSTFTFSDSRNNDFNISSFYKFFGVTLVSFGITSILLNILTSSKISKSAIRHISLMEVKFGIKKGIISKQWPTIAKILTIGVSTFVNFFGYKFLVF